jgi:hypothetical protein
MLQALAGALPAVARPMEVRIDVALPPDTLEAELERVHARVRRFGGALCGLRPLPIRLPGLAFRFREADGEQYVYVEDLANRRLAGYTVFNRLIEVDRHADRHLRAPHSRYGRMYQRRGIASAVYRWALEGGMCLITGARQSPGAHALWHSLSSAYALGYVELKDKALTYLGPQVEQEVLEGFHTRMVLLGEGWDVARFVDATRARWSVAARESACLDTGSRPAAL